jgi:hypothetical protein
MPRLIIHSINHSKHIPRKKWQKKESVITNSWRGSWLKKNTMDKKTMFIHQLPLHQKMTTPPPSGYRPMQRQVDV